MHDFKGGQVGQLGHGTVTDFTNLKIQKKKKRKKPGCAGSVTQIGHGLVVNPINLFFKIYK